MGLPPFLALAVKAKEPASGLFLLPIGLLSKNHTVNANNKHLEK